jgi:hypothetical protein
VSRSLSPERYAAPLAAHRALSTSGANRVICLFHKEMRDEAAGENRAMGWQPIATWGGRIMQVSN